VRVDVLVDAKNVIVMGAGLKRWEARVWKFGAKKMGAAYTDSFIDLVWQIVVMYSPLSCI
jgi:hypothetical protein